MKIFDGLWFAMSHDSQQLHLPMTLSVQWRALAERKIAHLTELGKSGRWNCYYSEEQFSLALEDARRLKEEWDNVVRKEIFIASTQSSHPPQQLRNEGLHEG
jgi:hypothetical protein